MVAQATSNDQAYSGLRPINSSRDIVSVAALVEQAFADDMDAAGRKAMREMRLMGQWFGWMDFFATPGQGALPGFVWIESGRIVGNVTVRRLSSFGHGWMIGNVAVDSVWRRRGIARQLMQAAIDLAREQDADWISLQVRSDNASAHDLYRSLGFEDVGETVYFDRAHFDPIGAPPQLVEGRLRTARPYDAERIYTLAQASVPDSVRWAEPVYRSSFDLSAERRVTNWLTNTQQVWRVIEVGDQLWGAALAEVNRRSRQGKLFLWVVPARAGRIEQVLVDSVLAEIKTPVQQMTARVPGSQVASRVALATRGFQQVRALTHMRLTIPNK
ncbi:MAG: GNAT family N-acetyltransferase [Thermoflexales bacterium]|nr:GNAT family N-acetyltransferase [Thermoflexales bacterium]